MLESDRTEEENIIVKKIEGPSVDDEYDFFEEDSYYEDEESHRSKLKLLFLSLITLLIGGGAFYLIQNRALLQNDKVATSTVEKEPKTEGIHKNLEEEKRSSTLLEPKSQPIEVEQSTPKEKKSPSIVSKSEPKVEKEPSTHYIEELAMPTVIEKDKVVKKERKIEEPKSKKVAKVTEESEIATKENEIKKLKVSNIQEVKGVKVKRVVTKPEVHKTVKEKVTPKKPKVKKVIVKKRKPTFVAHYEKIKPRIIQVKKGDTLAILAKRFYGNEMEYKRIVRANRRLKSGKTALRLGEKLVIPRKDNKTKRRYIIVEKGNTLAMIAKKFYGDERAVSKIVRANAKIKSSRSLLHVGQKVYVPK